MTTLRISHAPNEMRVGLGRLQPGLSVQLWNTQVINKSSKHSAKIKIGLLKNGGGWR